MADRSGFEKLLIVSAASLAFLASVSFLLFFRTFRIPGEAMKPTLSAGDHILVRKTKDVGAGDVIAFHDPRDAKTIFAKRVVAAGGDTVELRDKELIVNGRVKREPYVIHDDPTIYPRSDFLPPPYRQRDQLQPRVIPANELFVMGDNRDHSSDSRYWGTVPRELVIGRVVSVVSRRGLRRVH